MIRDRTLWFLEEGLTSSGDYSSRFKMSRLGAEKEKVLVVYCRKNKRERRERGHKAIGGFLVDLGHFGARWSGTVSGLAARLTQACSSYCDPWKIPGILKCRGGGTGV